MNKIFLFILLIFISKSLKAQSDDQALSLGFGAGAARAYAGAPFIKTTLAYNGSTSFYFTPFFNAGLEAQIGTLAAGKVGTDHLNFTNDYQAAFAEANLHFGVFIDDQQNWFLDAARNFYAGAGFGWIHNRVTQINATIYKNRSIIPVLQSKFGYAFNIKDGNGGTFLKIDLSYSFNPTIGRGLDGYFGSMPQAMKSYVYGAIGFEYLIGIDNGGNSIRF
jgi:hypothetical protein